MCSTYSGKVIDTTKYKKCISLLSVIFGRHGQKNCKVKRNYLRHDQFYFKLSGTFPIVRNNCLIHYANAFNKNIY